MKPHYEDDGDVTCWCKVDDCPAAICNGPHVSHTCPNGDLVTQRYDDPTPCPFCGHPAPLAGSSQQAGEGRP